MSEGSGFGLGAGIGLIVVAAICGGLYGCPQYKVWTSEMDGKAAYAQAEQQRQVIVRTAQAKKDAAAFEAEAEVARSKGVAAANKIIGDSLKDNEAYLRWLWIEGLKEGKDGNTVIYIPTEAGLPILEADRLRRVK